VANTSGDAEVHAVVWNADHTINDKGTLGSDYAHPDWMNEAGDIVGFSRNASQEGRAFVYWHDGDHMIDLGTIGADPESEATGINNKGMIVGITFDRDVGDLKGWVSNRSGTITDLNTLIRQPHNIHVSAANTINDRGVIAAQGDLKNGEHHAVILVPENDFDMLAQMTAAMRNARHLERASPSVPAVRPSCRGNLRMRPHFCTGG
jgi:probable HAF family extracellular repeat protein